MGHRLEQTQILIADFRIGHLKRYFEPVLRNETEDESAAHADALAPPWPFGCLPNDGFARPVPYPFRMTGLNGPFESQQFKCIALNINIFIYRERYIKITWAVLHNIEYARIWMYTYIYIRICIYKNMP